MPQKQHMTRMNPNNTHRRLGRFKLKESSQHQEAKRLDHMEISGINYQTPKVHAETRARDTLKKMFNDNCAMTKHLNSSLSNLHKTISSTILSDTARIMGSTDAPPFLAASYADTKVQPFYPACISNRKK
ncbi:hypothetical protein O6H91_06G146400 [Diphasiastrum complanatum]|uniref:Uncharacterized protein n=1 Tax=Diphasiastrum complanatum TaxID=34168 RepID=A0ACC2DJU0_DIPCM|nr:hypothetical protein O6H91_06G146400 [Diphasiastrum complanatum]